MTHMCRHHIATCVSAASPPLIPHEKQGCAGLRLNSQYKQFFLPPPPPPRAAPPSAASSVHLFQKRSGTDARARSLTSASHLDGARAQAAILIKISLQSLQLLRVLNEPLHSVTLKRSRAAGGCHQDSELNSD